MRKKNLNDIFSAANYFAVDILENIFDNAEPSNKEIDRLEHELESRLLCTFDSQFDGLSKNALIIASDTVEYNALTIMLKHLCFQVDIVRNRNDLLNYYQKEYQLIVVSNSFRAVGINLIRSVFAYDSLNLSNSPLFILISSDEVVSAERKLFDHILATPFLFMDFKCAVQQHM